MRIYHLVFISILALLLIGLPVALQPVGADQAAVTPLPPTDQVDGRAGACYTFYRDPSGGSGRPYLPLAYDAGARWDRFDFNWPVLEPRNDEWNFGPHTELVDDLHAADVSVVGILQMTPSWASTQCNEEVIGGASLSPGQKTSFGNPSLGGLSLLAPQDGWGDAWTATPPQGLYEPWDDPANHWGDYVYHVVSYFSARGVKHWEMWNEPEWSLFWCGTSTDYARLLKVGYRATKDACLDCTVLFGGLHYWANPSYHRWVLRQLDQDSQADRYNHFFDVMSVHLYARPSSAYDEISTIREGMETYNVGDHPVWLTETGVDVWDDGDVDPDPSHHDFAATQEEAASYVIQSYANAWASGVERYFFFRTNDQDMAQYFGLMRNDGSLRPAYPAYQVATRYLISPTFTTRVQTGANVRVTLWGTPRGKVSVLWNRDPADAVYHLPATISSAELVDRRGATQTITSSDGVYAIDLPGATAHRPPPNEADYIIGGEPTIVIESEMPGTPPTASMEGLPAVTTASPFTVTWSAQDNQSGVWLYDVQVRDGPSSLWRELVSSTTATATQVTGAHGHTYQFRVRATDRVGHRSAWPDEPQAETTLDLLATLHVRAGTFFADEDRDGVWDRPIAATGEITLTDVTLSLRDDAGHVVPASIAANAITATVEAGRTYWLWARSVDHMRALQYELNEGGSTVRDEYDTLGLSPTTRVYLPAVTRQ